MQKKYVSVNADVDTDGVIRPLRIVWDDGRQWEVTNAKKLVGFKISGKFIIPKIGLAESLISPNSCGIQRKSWRHLLFVSTFLKELKKLDKQLL